MTVMPYSKQYDNIYIRQYVHIAINIVALFYVHKCISIYGCAANNTNDNKGNNMTTKIIAFANGKGGTGKSTCVIHLAHQLHLMGYSVEVMDSDTQASCLDFVSDRENTIREGKSLGEFPAVRGGLSGNVRINTDKDFVLIDTRGTINRPVLDALTKAHLVIIPLKLNKMELRPSKAIFDRILEVQEGSENGLPVAAFLRNKWVKGQTVARNNDSLVRQFDFPTFKTSIQSSTRIEAATDEGMTVMEVSQTEMDKKLSIQFKKLANEVIELFEEMGL